MPERKSNTVRLLPAREQLFILFALRQRCAALRNRANYLCRQGFFAREPVPSYTRLCKLLIGEPAYRALPSDMAQEVLKKLAGDWASFFALEELYREGKLDKPPSIPSYYKDRKTGQTLPSPVIPVKSPRSWACDAKTIELTLPEDMREGGRLVIPYRGILRHRGAFKTLEILEEAGSYYAHLSVEKEAPRRKARPYKPASGDIGPRMGLAVVIDADSQVRAEASPCPYSSGSIFQPESRDLMKRPVLSLSHVALVEKSSGRTTSTGAGESPRLNRSWPPETKRPAGAWKPCTPRVGDGLRQR
jgi:hypothetical protein